MSILASLPGLTNRKQRDAYVSDFLSHIPSGSKLLDAGAGECRYKKYCSHLDYISQDFCSYKGADSFGAFTNDKWDTSLIDLRCDITNIPLPSYSFDTIICCEVFEHLPDPNRAFEELSRLLKDVGTILLTAPFRSLYHQTPYFYFSGFSTFYYKDLASKNNLLVESIHANGDYRHDFLQEFFRIYRSLSWPFKVIFTLPFCFIYLLLLFIFFIVKPRLPESTFGYFVTFKKPIS